MLAEERIYLGGLPERSTLAPYLRDDRRVAHDGYVHWEGSRYGVPWRCILVPSTPVSVSPRPASGKGCPGETAADSRRPWQSR